MTGAWTERPVAFGPGGSLIGVLTSPSTPVTGDARSDQVTVVLVNAGIVHRIGPNRLYVSVARALADEGIHAFRFDLSGIGDSVVHWDPSVADLTAMTDRDIGAALDFLDSSDVPGRYVLAGLCSGADQAFRAARADARIVGVAMIDPDVHRTRGFRARQVARQLGRGRTWQKVLTLQHPWVRRAVGADEGAAEPRDGIVADSRDGLAADSASLGAGALGGSGSAGSESTSGYPEIIRVTTLPPRGEMERAFQRLVDRDVGLLCLFTGGLEERYNYRDQFLDAYPAVEFGDRLTLAYHAEADHTFSHPDARARTVAKIRDWVRSTSFRSAAARADDDQTVASATV